MSKLKQSDVLRYEKGRKSQSTVRRHYIQWRSDQEPPMPLRCDNSECVFYSKELSWNSKSLKLVLDHVNGVSGDNRPNNLQFLCPNCNSQQTTNGGANKGKVIQSAGGFAKVAANGKKHYTMPLETGKYSLKAGNVVLKKEQRIKNA